MRRLTTGLICAVALCCASNQPAEAGVIPDIYNFVFGPPGTPYFRTSYYGPVYGYGYGYRAYYRPAPYYRVRAYYPPVCPPCQPCGVACQPCGVGCAPCRLGGNCPGGNYAVDSGTTFPADDNWRSTPADSGAPRTYKEEDPDSAAGQRQGLALPPDGNEGRLPLGAPGDGAAAEGRETLKPATDVPQRQAAPIKEPEAGDATEKKADQTAPPANNGQLLFPSLNVDDKITWRPRPIRQRLIIRSRFPTPSIARTRVNPNDEWVPVSTATKIVSK